MDADSDLENVNSPSQGSQRAAHGRSSVGSDQGTSGSTRFAVQRPSEAREEGAPHSPVRGGAKRAQEGQSQ